MRKLYLTVGISASGKTTWAEDFITTNPNTSNLNRDTLRFQMVQSGSNWNTYKKSRANEKRVTEAILSMAMINVEMGHDIIISDTNLQERTRNQWKLWANDHGYDYEEVAFDISVEEAIRRDRLRENGVGESVIRQQYIKWLEYIGRPTYVGDPSKPEAVIVDIDGTVATMKGRTPYDWDKVDQDLPRSMIIDMVQMLATTKHIIFVSGRDGSCYKKTEEWLMKHTGLPNFDLYTREAGDSRKDSIIKEELFWTFANDYNIVGVLDDRPQVIRMWHELKVPNVICVGNPYIEF